ncbi:MAG: PRC-barrel domain-containing protein [Alphaproteobacteria bacterium]
MRSPLFAATAVVALLAGAAPTLALDPSYDPVLSTVNNARQDTTSNPNLPLQSRPGGVSSGERGNDPGEGMPPHSVGLAPTARGYPTGYPYPTTYYAPGPVYYSTTYPAATTTYVTPAAPTVVAPAVVPGTTTYVTTTAPYYGPTVVGSPPVTFATMNSTVGNEVVDVTGMRLGTITGIESASDGRSYAVVSLDPIHGARTVGMPIERLQHSSVGRVMVTATADQVYASPTWR